ncbi:proteoglycan 4 [Macadamia integrifolia]|uniref:proteoglycan 4 n=1 Tax=Macadamia integrifolia TaxID=60698 RepID=UPI001C50094E|nr:proteoglycan 4 [Macadamia integrifolia]
MAERTSRRRSFRFRMPRLLTPARATTKPPTESQPPTKQATEIPIQGSQFQPPRRPPGNTPSPQLQAQPQTESQPPSPSSTAPLRLPSQPPSPSLTASPPSRKVPPSPQSQKTFQSPSPSKTSPLRLPSQPPSPSLTASPPSCKVPPSPKSQKAFQPPSPSPTPQLQPAAAQRASLPPSTPSKDVPSPSHTASQPPSPSHTAPPQQTHRTIPLSPSPSRTAPEEQPESQAASQPSSPTQQAPPSLPTTQASSLLSMQSQKTSQLPSPLMLPAAQYEPALPQPPSQKPQPLVETSSKSVHPSQNENQIRTTTNSDDAAKYPSQASDQVVAGTSPSREVRETPFLQQTSPRAEETKAEQKRSLEPKREKPKPPADEEPKQRTITELISLASGLSAKTRGQPNITPQDGQKKQEKQAALEGKQTTETGFKERESKVVTAYPKERRMGSVPRPESTTFLGDQGILQRDIREDISKFVNKLAMGDPRQAIDEKSATVITMAGENRGAAMHVGTESAKREGSVPIHRSYKLDQHDNMETTTDEEGSSQRRMENPKTGEDMTTSAYINSNVQSINNSIVLNSSCSEINPGVHLILSQKAKEPINTEEKSESIEASKSELNITPAQKLTHEPTVRRRCLRGLFLESSDNDQNKPEKPRRHGCRHTCEKKQDKDKQTEEYVHK